MSVTVVKASYSPARFGSWHNATVFNAKGQRKAVGEATQWDDLVGPVSGLKMSSVAGKATYNFYENAIVFNSGGDIAAAEDFVTWNIQKEHKVKEDSVLKMHIHFEKEDAVARTFKLWYRIQANGEVKATAWIELLVTTDTPDEVFPYSSGTINQITRFADIDWSAVGISTTVQFRLTRSDIEAGDVKVTFIDGHVEIDSDGSNDEYIK